MGIILDKLKANREEMKKQKIANAEFRREALDAARAEYKKAYVDSAKDAVKSRAKREAMERYGYSKSERRKRAMHNFTKELGGLGDWAVGNSPTTHRKASKSGYKRSKAKKRKAGNPFDLGNLNDFDIDF